VLYHPSVKSQVLYMTQGSRMGALSEPIRLRTGIPSLDDILLGGLPKGHIYLLEGDPGTGKTTLGMQFLVEGKKAGESCLYVTLAESKRDLELSARSHNWSLEGVQIAEFMPEEATLNGEDQYSVFHPSEVELATTVKKLIAEIERVNPERLVIDSLTEFRLLAQDAIRYRRQLLALKAYLADRNTTVLLLDDRTSDRTEMQVHSIVHGIFRLENLPRSYGVNRRRIEILKVRGMAYRQGFHDYTVGLEGVTIYPRLVAGEHMDEASEQQHLSSGLAGLDTMFGGGIERGSSTLILGPPGIGKSSMATQYAFAAAMRGERAVLYVFDEAVRTAKARARGLGMQIDTAIKKRHLHFEQVDPAELSPGEFVSRIKREVEDRDTRVVVIDSLNGLQQSMSEEGDLALQLHELVIFLAHKNVAIFNVLTQHGLMGNVYDDIEISYLADSVLLIRYFEAAATLRRAISALKKRTGAHELTIRELRIGAAGLQIGEPLTGFKGVLTGTPDFIQVQELEEPEDGRKR
jgi:circadian clock protein KaiC